MPPHIESRMIRRRNGVPRAYIQTMIISAKNANR